MQQLEMLLAQAQRGCLVDSADGCAEEANLEFALVRVQGAPLAALRWFQGYRRFLAFAYAQLEDHE